MTVGGCEDPDVEREPGDGAARRSIEPAMESSDYSHGMTVRRVRGAENMLRSDPRGSERYRTICWIARIQRADDAGIWRVRNISNEGLMLAADVRVSVGEALAISFSETTTVCGTITWAREGRCGVAFDTPIDAAAVLRDLAAEQRTQGYRALRLPVESEAIITLHNDSRPIDLVDISQHGAGFRHNGVLDPDTELDLILSGGDLRRQALVRWCRDQRGGLWFTRQLDRADLESMAFLRR